MPLPGPSRFRAQFLSPVFVPLLIVASTAVGDGEETPEPPVVSFQQDVAPLLERHCVSCHNESLELGDLRLDRKEHALDADLIKKGQSRESLFIQRLEKSDQGIRMPPTGSSLTPDEKKILASWIDQGADWPDDLVLAPAVPSAEDPAIAPFFREIRDADHKAVKRRLEANPELTKTVNRDGYSPLLLAAYCSSPRCLKVLIEFGADLEAVTPQGLTALMLSSGNPAKCRTLLESGAKVHSQSHQGRTALHYAVSTGDSKAAAKLLLSHGANLEARDKDNRTPLGLAAAERQTGLLNFLLRHGADPKAVDPGHLAQNQHALDLLADDRFYQNGGAMRAAIHSAVMRGEVDLAKSLLLRGAPADQRYASGQTILIRAAYAEGGSVALLQALVEHGADHTSRDKFDRTALDWARTKGNTPMVSYLEKLASSTAGPPSPASLQPDDHQLPGAPPRTPREAAETGLRLLQRSNLRFFKKSGCIACHQQPITSVAVGLARERGFDYRPEPARIQTALYSIFLDANRTRYLTGGALGGNQDTTSSILFGLSAEGYPRTDATDAMVIQLAARQRDDGSWPTSGHRPPSEYSSISTTAFAIHALNAYPPPGLTRELKNRVATARHWLLKTDPRTVQEQATKLLGLAWSRAPGASITAVRDDLLEQQRADGGWSQLTTLSPDPYATGLALYALRSGANLPSNHPAYRKGADFLLRTQLSDGSWHVQGRTLKFQPYFESGFPHGEDQWISAHATGWAILALMLDHQ